MLSPHEDGAAAVEAPLVARKLMRGMAGSIGCGGAIRPVGEINDGWAVRTAASREGRGGLSLDPEAGTCLILFKVLAGFSRILAGTCRAVGACHIWGRAVASGEGVITQIANIRPVIQNRETKAMKYSGRPRYDMAEGTM